MTTTPNPPSIPGLAVLAALAVAVVAVAGVLVFYSKHNPVVPRESTSVSQATSDPPAVDPPAKLGDKDGRFLWLLEAQGLQLSGAPNAAINDARRICSRLARGESERRIVQDIVQGSPRMSMATAAKFADTAINVYCPQGGLETPH